MLKQCRRLAILASAIAPFLLAQGPAATNFGSVAVNGTATQTITFGVTPPASFSLQYGNGSEFQIGTPSCGASSCAVPVKFAPIYPGLQRGAIIATDQSGHLLATAQVYGVGLGPQIAITPGVISTIANRASSVLASAILSGVAVAEGGNVYVADSNDNVVLAVSTNTGQVTTYAGNRTAGYTGNGGLATSAELNMPSGLAFDGAGNLYIADTGNNVIREVNAFSGIITTVAGNGSAGFSGDNGAATSAQLSAPTGVVLDAAGDLYIADAKNNRVREVAVATGKITTVAGSGVQTYSGDGGSATNAGLSNPFSVALDASGNLYIADSLNSVIREVVSGNISTVAGVGSVYGYSGDGGPATSAHLNAPQGVAVDAGNNIYIADSGNNVIRKVTGDASHIITTVAGTGNASYSGDGGASTSATMNLPTMVAVDVAGNVYVIDSGNYALREVTATPAPLSFPATANGQTSAVMTLTVSNTGNQNLTVSSLSFTGNFSQQSSTNACTSSTSLAEGASCTIALTFSATAGGSTSGTFAITNNSLNQSGTQSQVALSESAGLRFVAVTPCRVADTRNATGAFGGPLVSGQTSRSFAIPASACGIPSTAQAFSLNVTVVPNQALGYLTVWPTGQSQPTASTLNSADGRVKANAAIVPAGTGGAISVFASNDTNVVLDIDGYFVPESTTSALAFFPLTPCRIADTRSGSGSFGAPFISGQATRQFPILSSSCNIPSTAQAYSLNFTAVPRGPLGYLTTWPTGQSQPVVSTLNAITAAVTANAAIVPAGTGGSISVFASNNTDLVIDISGYFGPAASGGLSLYNLQPCRVLDTRLPSGSAPINGSYNVGVSSSACGVPSVAQAYILNATVVPLAPLGYLTLWPEGEAQPFQSTLNASDAVAGSSIVTSNLAIVPTTNGSISAFVSNPTHLVLDIFGYFAP